MGSKAGEDALRRLEAQEQNTEALARLAAHEFDQMTDVLDEVEMERRRQDAKWGEQNHPPMEFFSILAEEFGEVGKEVVEMRWQGKSSAHFRTELIQLAAVAVAMVESLDRNGH